jgi:dipeptidyl aminopeptidase/acylaminoacyl peptidase
VVGLSGLLYALTATAAAATGFVLGFPYLAARRLLSPPRMVGSWTPRDLGFSYEDVAVEAGDGVELRGWFIDVGSHSTVIAIHGYTSSRWDETYMKPVIRMLASGGFNVAAFDFRGHGASGGRITTLGVREVEDYKTIISWLKTVKADRAEKLGVIGYSMGGAVALMLAALDGRVNAVVADSPYMDIVESGRRWIKRMGQPLRGILLALYPLVVAYASKIGGVDPSKLKLYQYADRIRVPLLLIAGGRDDLVSVEEVEKFYSIVRRVNSSVELWVTSSKHVRSIVDYPEEYEKRVLGFFRRWLG